MKKILVLGALSLFCLSNAGAIGGRTINTVASILQAQREVGIKFREPEEDPQPAASLQAQKEVRIKVRENGVDPQKEIPLTDLKTASFRELELRDLIGDKLVAAFNALLRCGKQDLSGIIIPKGVKMTLEQLELYCLDSAKFKRLIVRDNAINDEAFPLLLEVLKRHKSLGAVQVDNIRGMSVEKMLDLCEVLKGLPVLRKIDMPYCKWVKSVYDKLGELNYARAGMLFYLRYYIEHKDRSHLAPCEHNYDHYRKEVERLTEELDREIDYVRGWLPVVKRLEDF